jgi:hypothetical protein
MSTNTNAVAVGMENVMQQGQQHEDFLSKPVCDVAGVQI